MVGFKFGFEDDWEFDSGMDEDDRSESTSGDGELGRCEVVWKAGSGGDGDEFVDNKFKGRGEELIVEHGVRNSGELDREEFCKEGVRSGGEFDGEESSEDGVRGGGDLDGDGSGGAISVDLNTESVVTV